MNDGEITPKTETFDREHMLGFSKVNDTNAEGKKEKDDPKK